MKRLLTILTSAAILAAGSVSANSMAQGLNITGGENPFAKLELKRVDNAMLSLDTLSAGNGILNDCIIRRPLPPNSPNIFSLG